MTAPTIPDNKLFQSMLVNKIILSIIFKSSSSNWDRKDSSYRIGTDRIRVLNFEEKADYCLSQVTHLVIAHSSMLRESFHLLT